MAIFNPKEFSNFAVRARRSPILAAKAVWDLAGIVGAKIITRLKRKTGGDIHKSDRINPAFLPRLVLQTREERAHAISICVYNTDRRKGDDFNVSPPAIATDEGGDIEAFYSGHRWSFFVNALFDDEKAMNEAATRTLSWINDHKDKQKPEWEPYSSCERVVNLAAALCARRELLTLINQSVLVAFFEDSLIWIDSHLEYYKKERTNNHILNNARALVVCGSLLNNVSAVEKGTILFSRMADRLFHPDGFLRERSSHYQVVVANWLMDTLHFASGYTNASAELARSIATLHELSTRVARSTSLICRGTGELSACIGDISPDMSPSMSLARLKLLYPDFFSQDDFRNEFISDGWFYLKKREHSIIGNIPLDYPVKYPTHGHNDIGSFIWLHNNSVILSDPGRFRYTSDPVSFLQLQASAHNCITIDGFSPVSEPLNNNGGWNPDYYARTRLGVSCVGGNCIRIQHDGFSRISGVGKACRRICFEESALVVYDEISGSGMHNVLLRWSFFPGIEVEQKNNSEFVACTGGAQISCRSSTVGNEGGSARTGRYRHSEQYGAIRDADFIEFEYFITLPCSIKTVFNY